MAGRVWTEEDIAWLKALWTEGHTAADIARIMGLASRSAAIGKLHRIGCTKKDKPNGGVRVSRPRKAKAPEAEAEVEVKVVEQCPPGEFPERRDQCRYIIGNIDATRSWYCCGQKTVGGESWCKKHKAIVYTKNTISPRSHQSPMRRSVNS